MSQVVDPEKKKEFLKELTELSKKYELEIGGCGCCGSPFLSVLTRIDGQYDPDSIQDIIWKTNQ